MRSGLAFLLLALISLPPAAWGQAGEDTASQNAVDASQKVFFPRPAELEPRVRFWIRIYSEVTTDAGLIHDSEHLDVVYEVLRFKAGSSRRARERQTTARKRHWAHVLRGLARGKRSRLSGDEKRALGAWPGAVSNPTLRAGSRRIRFQLGQADRFRAGLVRSGAWRDYIEGVFRERGLPVELAAMPHVESSFNPGAYSHAGAAGIWQFTRSTGRRFLRIDHVLDERLDPYLATVAAARLLEENFRAVGTWPLAITAYNHGAGGMSRARRKLGTSDIATIVARYKSRSFGFASRNFYCEFLAALEVQRNAASYFGELQLDPPARLEAVTLEHFYPVAALARALGVDPETLKVYNRSLSRSVWLGEKHVPRGFLLRVPPREGQPPAAEAIAGVASSKRYAKQRRDRHYRVRRGDSLSRIARRFGVRQTELVALNGLRSRHRIRVGQVLRLPLPPGERRAASSRSVEREAAPADGRYRVRPGDSLTVIAARFDLRVDDLARDNGIRNRNALSVGQTLRLTGSTSETKPAPAQATEPAPAKIAAAEPPKAQTSPTTPADDLPLAAAPAAGPLPSFPALYAVQPDARIEVQPNETLGHYADWLEIPAARLRRLNGLSRRAPVVVGQTFRLDLSRAMGPAFERRRLAYHRELQKTFWDTYRVAGTRRYVLRPGDSLWRLAQESRSVPLWLIRNYNPNLDFSSLHPGLEVTLPRVERRG